MKKGKRKKLKYLWLILPALIIIAAIVITAVNSTYQYEAVNTQGILAEGEKGLLTIIYDGAEGKPESETVEYKAYETIELPEVSKEGYNFSGWQCNRTFCGDKVTLNSKEATARPQFDKDYSGIKSPAALYSGEFTYEEYDVGEYPSVNQEIVDLYLDGGYKMTIYGEENFAGDEKVIAYTGTYSGLVGSMKIEEVHTDGIRADSLTDEVKYELLKTFAPRIWWDKDEEFFAATIEEADSNMSRVMSNIGYTYVLEDLDKPDYMCDYLYGDRDNAKAYAFAVEKEYKYLDLSYFVFTPYNKSKEILGRRFGNHIGDWEHITVRLMKYDDNGHTYYRPVIAEYSAHSFKNYIAWDELQIINGTHPVAYTAQGSHGMWKDAGTHVYINAYIAKLTDECSEGTSWDLWEENQMETYSYDALNHTGKGIGKSIWSSAFDLDYYNEDSMCVTNWGNRGWYPPIQLYPQLQNGPGGPQQKRVINDYYTMNTMNNKLTESN